MLEQTVKKIPWCVFIVFVKFIAVSILADLVKGAGNSVL